MVANVLWHRLTFLSSYGIPNVGEFMIASSISDLNSSYDTSDFILCNGRKSTLPHVLLRGLTSFQNLIVGLGSKPSGGTSLAQVANISTSLSFTLLQHPSSSSKKIYKCCHIKYINHIVDIEFEPQLYVKILYRNLKKII